MASSAQRPADTERRLTQDFAAWIDNEPVAVSDFYQHGLIVLDANVLLDLYRRTPDTRDNVIRTLRVVANANRLWVPHQAAIEFSRNRKKTVEDRTKAFKSAESSLKQARANAVEVLEKALGDLEKLRLRYETTREWDPAAAGLDRDGLTARLRGAMDPALEELAAHEAEYDLRPQDMQCIDPVLKQIDELLAGRIGRSYDPDRLRELVSEAVDYRFPNEIPPGHRDVDKATALRRAGDFLLWRQTLDRASELTSETRLVLLVTQEKKSDWWELRNDKPVRVLPELVQEMRDTANAHLLLASLADFMSAAASYIGSTVSEKTVDELRRAEIGRTAYLDAFRYAHRRGPVDLLAISPTEFELLVVALLGAMGYTQSFMIADALSDDEDIDALVEGDGRFGTGLFVVQAKRWRGTVAVGALRILSITMTANAIDGGLLITTGRYTNAARAMAEGLNIQTVAGDELVRLLSEHLDIDARIGPEGDA